MVRKRILGLDIIRAVAILLVVYQHGMFIFYPFMNSILGNITFSLSGFWGVELFFTLSGYLIGTIFIKNYDKEPDFGLKQIKYFLNRRWLRTLPNYFLCLTVFLIIVYINDKALDFKIILQFVTFTQSFVKPNIEFFRHSWSLAIEEWFYLLFPLVVYMFSQFSFLKVKKQHALLLSIVAFIIVGNGLRIMALFNGSTPAQMLHLTLYRLDAIAYGVFFSYIDYYYPLKLSVLKYKLLVGAFVLLGIIFMIHVLCILTAHPSTAAIVLNVFLSPIAFCMILPAFLEINRIGHPLFSKIITGISKVSYSVYLIHFDLLYVFSSFFLFDNLYSAFFYFLLEVIVILFVSYLLYRFWEKPFIDYRENHNNLKLFLSFKSKKENN